MGSGSFFFLLNTQRRVFIQTSKRVSLQIQVIQDTMISYEEYDKKKNSDDEDYEKLPTVVIVIVIVLLSLVGIYIVCDAIYGL